MGVFSNNIIGVTSGGSGSGNTKGVWRVDAQRHPTLLTNLATPHLEGVITLPNTNFYGPWAGKIITGDEDATPPVIYSIATNGAVVTFDTTMLFPGGIHPEDFDVIPPGQDLYACDPDRNMIVRLSAGFLANYVGDLLITDAGERGNPNVAKLFIIHWDTVDTIFVTHRVLYIRTDGSNGRLEHVTFAPIHLPSL